jgi:hypothetical protein
MFGCRVAPSLRAGAGNVFISTVLPRGHGQQVRPPRAVLFDLEPGVIEAVRASSLGELFRPGSLVNQAQARETTGPRATPQELITNSSNLPVL